MWHEARKQERIVRKVIVDYRRRAERRHDYYDKIKQDPTKFMQVHGKKLKLIIEENSLSNDTSHMVPWQGDKSNMIDRFDVRAHLDFIKETPQSKQKEMATNSKEERRLNYERYRILVYNQHKGISEAQHLHKIHINETYPELTAQKQEAEAKKQLLQTSKASIGFDYGGGDSSSGGVKEEEAAEEDESEPSSDEDDFLSELEDIPSLRDLNPTTLQDLEKQSLDFGMGYTDFVKEMDQDQDMQLRVDAAKAIETEKLKMSGKKSRRERRFIRDQRLKDRVIGPLSYMQRDESDKNSGSESESSGSDDDREQDEKKSDGEIEFITSFGDNNGSGTKLSPKPHAPTTTITKSQTKHGKKPAKKSRSRSRSKRSRSRDRQRRSRSRSRGYARSRSRDRQGRSRSRSRGYARSRRDSESSYRRDAVGRRQRSGSRDRSYRRRSRSSDRWSRRSRSHDRWSRNRRSRSRGGRSRSRDRRSPFCDQRSRSRERVRSTSRDRSPGKIATATLKSTTPVTAKPSLSATAGSAKKLTPQERLKLKMQKALKKQLKADKIAMAGKRAQAYHEQLEREDELREMARKMRRREYDKRDKEYDRDTSYGSRSDFR